MPDQANGMPTPPPNAPVFKVEKIYLKDLSFESPNVPEVFLDQQEPKVSFNLDTSARQVQESLYETVITATAKVNVGEKTLFLVELTYGGLFTLKNIPQEHMAPMLGIECPNVLFPYVRQIISNTVADGGFKPLVLDPINFAALFYQAQQQGAAGAPQGPAQ